MVYKVEVDIPLKVQTTTQRNVIENQNQLLSIDSYSYLNTSQALHSVLRISIQTLYESSRIFIISYYLLCYKKAA